MERSLLAEDDSTGARRASAWQIADGIPTLARLQALIGIGGGLVGALGLLLPHPDYYVPGLLLTQFLSIAFGVALYASAERIPTWILTALPTVATLMVSITVISSSDATGPYALFYLWPSVYSFYFLSRWEAGSQIGFTAVNFIAVALLVGSPPVGSNPPVLHFVITATATLAGGGILQVYMRSRVESLVTRLESAATFDLHTGFMNRRGVAGALDSELTRAQISGRSVSVLVGELDGFKRVSDAIGHEAADRVIAEVGTLLADSIGPLDRVGRTGPAEFTVILPEADQGAAFARATDLLSAVRASFVHVPEGLTMSLGIASYPEHSPHAAGILQAAESAAYGAKVLGHDRVVVFSEQIEEMVHRVDDKRAASDASQLATVMSLAEALDLREGSTARHSQVVGGYCERIARELGFTPERIERVRLAGVLHDIGKIAIPDSILGKPARLTDEEFEQMRRHPEIGARMLASSELSDLREWVLSHHERPDGNGYPRRLRDEEIPIEAKIVSACDAYEAMTADRVYRKAPGSEFARRELRRNSGTQFDPVVVSAFERVLEAAGSESAAGRLRGQLQERVSGSRVGAAAASAIRSS